MKSTIALEEFVNLTELLDRVENDEELLGELFALFQEDLPECRSTLRTAIDGADLGAIERAAHKLKGMLASLSAKRAASLAGEVESAASSGDSSPIADLMSAFDPEITGLSAALDSFTAST